MSTEIKDINEATTKLEHEALSEEAIKETDEKSDEGNSLKSASCKYFKNATAFEKLTDAAAVTGATGAAGLTVLIVSDFRILLWYKRRKANKNK